AKICPAGEPESRLKSTSANMRRTVVDQLPETVLLLGRERAQASRGFFADARTFVADGVHTNIERLDVAELPHRAKSGFGLGRGSIEVANARVPVLAPAQVTDSKNLSWGSFAALDGRAVVR